MIYFDTSYLLRLYLKDTGWERVRERASANVLCCCLLGKAEVVAAFHRKLREGEIKQKSYAELLRQFETDCEQEAFRWLPLSEIVVLRAKKVYAGLPPNVFVRAADALHLGCAAENGQMEIFTNDRAMLAAAPYFGVRALDII